MDEQLDLFIDKNKKKKPQSKRAKSAQNKRNTKKGNEAQRRAEEKRGEEEFGRDGDQKPEDIWPNYPRMNFNPVDLLKIIPALGGFNLQRAKADTTDIVDQLMINPEIADQVAGIYSSNSAGNEEYWGEVRPKGVNYNISPQQMQKNIDKLKLKIGPIINKAEAPSSRTIRDHLKPGTKGLRDYDKSGGGRGISDEEWLKLIRSVPTAMGERTGRSSNRSLMPDGNYGVPKEGMKVNTGGLKGEDYIFRGNKWVKNA
jgi:hypothetical protein